MNFASGQKYATNFQAISDQWRNVDHEKYPHLWAFMYLKMRYD